MSLFYSLKKREYISIKLLLRLKSIYNNKKYNKRNNVFYEILHMCDRKYILRTLNVRNVNVTSM